MEIEAGITQDRIVVTLDKMDMWELAQELGYETHTGRINFRSPFYAIICKKLGLKYSSLSRTGKAVLKANAIDTYNSPSWEHEDHISEGNYFR